MGTYHQPDPGTTQADILVLVAGDASMQPAVTAFQNTISAVDAGVNRCPSDVRVTLLSIGTAAFPGTEVDPTLKTYLTALNVANLKERDKGTAPADGDYDLEFALIDACPNFDWRKGAKRAVLLVGNQWPDGGGATAQATSNSSAAIQAAKDNQVAVFTCLTQPAAKLDAGVVAEYQALAVGGAYLDASTVADPSTLITDALQKIICTLAPVPVPQPTSCSGVCEEFSSIVCTINMLACALNKAIDACCPDAGANTGCDCGCSEKKIVPPLVLNSAAGNAAAIPHLSNAAKASTGNALAAKASTAPAAPNAGHVASSGAAHS